MTYKKVGNVGDNAVYENPRNGKLIVHFVAVAGNECNKPCPDGYDSTIWHIDKVQREFSNAFYIAKEAHNSVRQVNNKNFGGGLSFDLSLQELNIWN